MTSTANSGDTDFAAGAALFKALADPHRLKVLHLLAQPQPSGTDCCLPDSVCACDLEAVLGLSQPTVSHHMRLLVRAGLVTATRRGKWTYYTLRLEGFAQARAWLAVADGSG